MNLPAIKRSRTLTHKIATGLTLGLIGLGGTRAESAAEPELGKVSPRTEAVRGAAISGLLWEDQMQSTKEALNQKNYALAEFNGAEALKTARKFRPPDARVITNLVLMGEIYQSENKTSLAGQTFKLALATQEQAVGTNDPSLVMPLEKLANFHYFAERRYDLATPLCLRILQLVESTSPRDDAEVEKRTLALAVIHRLQGHYSQAEPYYRKTLELVGKNDGDLSGALLATAGYYHDWGKLAEAETLCQRALTMQEKAAAASTNSEAQINLAVSLYGLAENYRHWGKLDQAEPLYRRSMAIVATTAGPDHSDLARPLTGLAATLVAQGKTNQATALYQQALAVVEKSLEAEDPAIKSVLNDYTALLDTMNRPAEAKALRQEYQWQVLITRSQRARRVNALEVAERLVREALLLTDNFSPADTRRARSQVQMAEIYRRQEKTELAEQAYHDAIASYEKAVGTNSPDLIMPLESLADFCYTTKMQYDQVATLQRRILNILQADPEPNRLEVARWERNLADVCHLQGQNVLAEAGYKRALATVETVTNSVDDQVQYLQVLADFYQAGGRGDEAELAARRALALRERASGPDAEPDAQMGVAICNDALAQLYLAHHKPVQAELFFTRSAAIIQKVAGADSPELAPRLLGLAAALRVQKNMPRLKSRPGGL